MISSLLVFSQRALLEPMVRTVQSPVPVVQAPAAVTPSQAAYANQVGQGSIVTRTSMSVRQCRLKRCAWRKMPSVSTHKEDTTVGVHLVTRKMPAIYAKVGMYSFQKNENNRLDQFIYYFVPLSFFFSFFFFSFLLSFFSLPWSTCCLKGYQWMCLYEGTFLWFIFFILQNVLFTLLFI